MLAKLLLTNETPVFLGGYTTNYKSDNFTEGLRAQSLKGLLRYWLRAYLAGAGMDVNEIRRESCRLLGGKVDKETYASKVQIKSNIIEERYSTFFDRSIPRVNLLVLGRRPRLDCASLLKVRLLLTERIGANLTNNEKTLIIGSLLTSFLLSGIGKMSRRGYGTFKISVNEDESRLFRSDINTIFEETTNDEKRKDIILRIIENTKRNLVQKPLKEIPYTSAIHKDYFKLIYIYMRKRIKEVITDLQNFTLRPQRARILFGNFRAADDITKEHLAWFLGLPRAQRGTGYNIKDRDVQRRASPLFISVHRSFTLVSLFLSRDWPINLEWKGATRRMLRVNLGEIQKAYNTTFDLLTEYLNKLNYKYEVIYGE